MNDTDLEARLHDLYSTFTPEDSGWAVTGVGRVISNARARTGWTVGRWGAHTWLRGVAASAAAMAVVAALAVALLPVWHGSTAVPGAGATDFTTPAATGTPPPSPTNSPAASLAPNQASQIGMGRNGGLWAVRGSTLQVSADHGRTWHASALPQQEGAGPLSVTDVAVLDATDIWVIMSATTQGGAAAGTTESLYNSLDGGATWHMTMAETLAGNNVVGHLAFVDKQVGFAVFTPWTPNGAQPSTIMRTVNAGAGWLVTNTSAVLGDLVAPTDADTLWTGSDQNMLSGPGPLLRVSHDGGATWSGVALPGVAANASQDLYLLYGPFGGLTFLNATDGYLAIFQRTSTALETRYYRTADGGRTWSLAATLPRQEVMAPVFVDATHWYQPDFADANLDVTVDGGKTWTAIGKADLPGSQMVAFWMIDGQDGVAFGLSGSSSSAIFTNLYVTWDGAKTWHETVYPTH